MIQSKQLTRFSRYSKFRDIAHSVITINPLGFCSKLWYCRSVFVIWICNIFDIKQLFDRSITKLIQFD
jgi:hypothetical protein